MVKGKQWYSLTADYAFGHDLLKVAKLFMEKNGGQFAADELIPTDISDFSPFLLKIRQARPDIVISNLAGNQITDFLKQYSEYGLQFPVVGFRSIPRSRGASARAISPASGRSSGIISSIRPPRRSTSRRSARSTASRRTTSPGATTTRSRSSRSRWPR